MFIEITNISRKDPRLGQPRNHGCARTHSELGEDSAQVSADRPYANTQYVSDHLIWMTKGYHANDFTFPRAQ